MNFHYTENKEENKYLEPFVKYYFAKHGIQIQDLNVENTDSDSSSTAPDFYLVEPRILLEVKRIMDQGWKNASASLEQSMNKLQIELNKMDSSVWVGLIRVGVPANFRIPKGKENAVAMEIMDAIRKGFSDICIPEVGFVEISYRPELSHLYPIYVSLIPQVGWVDPAKSLNQIFIKIIQKANAQLGCGAHSCCLKKILLLVNRHQFSPEDPSLFRNAAREIIPGINTPLNINEIWLQGSETFKAISHHKLFPETETGLI